MVVWAVVGVVCPVAVGVLQGVTAGWWGLLPAGGTGVVCGLVAGWGEEVPTLYRYRVVLPGFGGGNGSAGEGNASRKYITVSEKTVVYVLAAQLSLSQFPYNLVPAVAGWVVGSAWRADLLPGGMGRWRIAGWIVGQGGAGKGAQGRGREEYAGLRRRLEEEGASHGAVGDGMRRSLGTGAGATGDGREGGETGRGVVGSVREYFRGLV